jgi:hypothetical protein
MGDRFTAYCGSPRRRKLTLCDALENPLAGLTPSAVPSAQVWAGDSTPTAWTPTATWIDAAEATLEIAWPGAATSAIEPGRYLLRVGLTSGGVTSWYPAGEVELLAAPGTTPARPVYSSATDLADAVPWLEQLQLGVDQAGFAERRAEAREWLDELIVSSWWGDPDWIRARLDAGGLVVRPWVKRACSIWAASRVLLLQPGGKDGVSYRSIGEDLAASASLELRMHPAEVSDGSGGTIRLVAGRLVIRRG